MIIIIIIIIIVVMVVAVMFFEVVIVLLFMVVVMVVTVAEVIISFTHLFVSACSYMYLFVYLWSLKYILTANKIFTSPHPEPHIYIYITFKTVTRIKSSLVIVYKGTIFQIW